MKGLLLMNLVCGLYITVNAQKISTDIMAIKNWPWLTNPIVSPNKQFVAYQLTDSTVTLQNIKTGATNKFVIPNYKTHLSFSFDSTDNYLVFQSLAFRAKPAKQKDDGVALDIWSWKDSALKSAQLYQESAPDSLITKDYISVTDHSKLKTDTVQWSWTSWKNNVQTITLSRNNAKRLEKKYPTTAGSIQILAQLNKREFLLIHQPPNRSANLILTKGFKSFEALTDITPQNDYNWYTTESLKFGNDTSAQATLCKPEDFDSTKKYPIIIALFDSRIIGKKSSDTNRPWLYNGNITGRSGTGLYNPILSNGILNTPYFTSNGYIVLEIPSVIETGRPGPAMYDKVMNAITRLKELSWVDTARLGIHGQGTSGYFVSYIITQTNIFKAAQETSGQTDLISHYGSIDGKGESMQSYYDSPNGFFGKTLWEDSAAYIWQSPVILANRIQTPLLIMHNKEDMVTPFAQSIELFTGMRRLGNRCWLLQYDNEQHTLTKIENQEDFTIRLQQFYDHYLKDKGAPIWMTRGVAAKDRGTITGLEIDPEIKTPPVGGLLRKN